MRFLCSVVILFVAAGTNFVAAETPYAFAILNAPSPNPATTWTYANGINNAGQVVGCTYYYDPATSSWSVIHAFLNVLRSAAATGSFWMARR